MPARKRGSGNPSLRKRSTEYENAVCREVGARPRFVQLGCIAARKLARAAKLVAIASTASAAPSATAVPVAVRARRDSHRVCLPVPEDVEAPQTWPTLTPAGVEPELDVEKTLHRSKV